MLAVHVHVTRDAQKFFHAASKLVLEYIVHCVHYVYGGVRAHTAIYYIQGVELAPLLLSGKGRQLTLLLSGVPTSWVVLMLVEVLTTSARSVGPPIFVCLYLCINVII